jgi:hypothetical protein
MFNIDDIKLEMEQIARKAYKRGKIDVLESIIGAYSDPDSHWSNPTSIEGHIDTLKSYLNYVKKEGE